MSLYVATQPLLIFSNLFGIGPYGYMWNGQFFCKKLNIIFPVISLVLLIFLQSFIFMDYSGTMIHATSLTTDMIDTYGFASTCLGSFIAHLLLRDAVCDIFSSILSVYRNMEYSATLTYLHIVLGLSYEAVFALVSIYISPFEYSSFFFYAVETVTYVALELVSYVIFLQFCHLLLVSERAFKDLNSDLKKLVILAKQQPLQHTTTCCYFLRRLQNEHSKITCRCRKINEIFGFQNLCSIALIFLELIYAFYDGIVREGATFSIDNWLWAGYFAYKLYVTVRLCCAVSQASQETAVVVFELTSLQDHPSLLKEVEYFSLQLLHDRLSFDVFEFFPLDFTLVSAIIGSVGSYLIVLVQFRNEESPFGISSNCSALSSHYLQAN